MSEAVPEDLPKRALRPPSRRERYRAQTRNETKQIALRQLAEAGPSAMSLNAIAKELGVTGPALYRYFAGRDELLTELVVDAYNDLADAVEEAAHEARRQSPQRRLRVLAQTYRRWALDQPHRYRLLYGEPIPGYPAHTERTIRAAQRTYSVLVANLEALAEESRSSRDRLTSQLADWSRRNGYEHIRPETLLAGVRWWTRIHGVVSLEIEGNWASMGIDGDLVFEGELAVLIPMD